MDFAREALTPALSRKREREMTPTSGSDDRFGARLQDAISCPVPVTYLMLKRAARQCHEARDGASPSIGLHWARGAPSPSEPAHARPRARAAIFLSLTPLSAGGC